MHHASRPDRGFSIVELLLVVAIIATVGTMAVPLAKDLSASIKLSEAARTVERELQSARLKAVSTNRALRVRPNCPAAGYLRTVEVIGDTSDNDSNRCIESVYPYPAADTNAITRPNFDGPVRPIPNGASVTNDIIEFRPDGTAMQVVSNVVQAITTPVTITISRETGSRSVTVNAAGKIELVR